jgi:ubiquinone/menaquinone biosynthesis C-methylase UbiE
MSLLNRSRSFITRLLTGNSKNSRQAHSHPDINKPPQHLIDLVGGGDYLEIGKLFFNYFIDLGNLKPNDRVLDIGCGAGRMALPITRYLNSQGSYEGFDIVKELVDWAKHHITPHYPNFRFQLANIYNSCYNPKGKYRGTEYTFPYKNKEFDFIFLTSVFTHMLPAELENYLAEIARTLKPGGKCLVTFFILNETVHQLILDKKSTFQFAYTFEDCRIDNTEVPEAVVGYEEEKLKGLFTANDFDVESINYGNWSGRKDFLSFQDIIVLKKKI